MLILYVFYSDVLPASCCLTCVCTPHSLLSLTQQYLASTSAPQYQEVSGAAAGPGLAPTASVLHVINSLYCSHATAGAAAHQQRKWQELDPDGKPLMQQHGKAAAEASRETQRSSSGDLGVMEAAMAAAHAEQSCASSVGSWDPTAAGQAASPADEAATEQQQQQQRAYTSSLSFAASATSDAGLAEPEASSSGASATADACSAADEQECEADADATASDEAGTEDGAAEQPCDLQQQQQGGVADIEAVDGGQAGAAACLAAVQQQLDSRLALQQELSGYVAGLAARLGDDGEQLVTLPADYQLMVSGSGVAAACHESVAAVCCGIQKYISLQSIWVCFCLC